VNMPRTIYLDTTLWNKLFDHAVDPAALTHSLKVRGWALAISPQLLYEFGKSFHGKRIESRKKAMPLFSYLEQYLDFPLLCVKQVPDLLREEVKVAAGLFPKVEAFYQGIDRDRMTDEIRQLAAGQVHPRFDSLLKFRSDQVSDFREYVRLSTARGSANVTLECFMQNGLRQFGRSALEQHISRVIPGLAPREVKRSARKALSSRRFRLSHALVRADLYLNWLRSQGKVVRRDTLDDCYHIENAAYCDAYATDDFRQQLYADKILTETVVRIHDRTVPLPDWLTSQAIQ